MADVSVDATVSTSTARGMRSVVFTTELIGYVFYIDSDGVFGYSKTTDGGAVWGAQVDVDGAAATTTVAFDVWFDKWTPGDTGTLIHCWWFDSTNDIVRWRTLNTSGDTLGTVRTVFTGASAVAGRGAFVSGTKTRSGYLYCAYDIDAGAERGLHRSTDSGTTWSTNLATTFVEATLDTCALFPASGTGDDNDCWALYYDASALALTLKLWDSSAAAQVESATIGVAHTDGATDLTGQFGYSGSVRHSDGHLIVAALSGRDVAASTHQVFDIASTSSITTKTAIAASTDDHYYPQVFIDQSTDAIYVAYNGKRDGSEVLDTTTKVYYTKSTDGGATWTSGDTAYMEGAAGIVQQVWTPLSGPRFYAVWRVGTTLLGNRVKSVLPVLTTATSAVYRTPGTYNWDWPAGVSAVFAECLGGGGGGGNATGNPAAGGGGGGGGYASATLTKGSESALTVFVGRGGVVGVLPQSSYVEPNPPIGPFPVKANSGTNASTAGGTGTNGSGGANSADDLNNAGSTIYTSGAGGNGNSTSGAQGSGAGGGAAGPTGAGVAGVANAAGAAGTGTFVNGVAYQSAGMAGVGDSLPGLAAPEYGGGGGSGGKANTVTDQLGGDGGNGVVVLTWTTGPASQSVSGATITSTSVVQSPQVVTPGAVTITGATRASTAVVQSAHSVGVAQAVTGTPLASSSSVITGHTVALVAASQAVSGAFLGSTAIVRVTTAQFESLGNSLSGGTTDLFAATAGDLIVVTIRASSGTNPDVASVTDVAGNTYSLAVSTRVQDPFLWIFYATNISGSPVNAVTVTFTTPAATHYTWIHAVEYSGVDLTAPLEAALSAYGNGVSDLASAAFSTTGRAAIVLGASQEGPVTFTAGTDFTLLDGTLTAGGQIELGAVEDYLTTAALTSYVAHITGNSSYQFALTVAAFKAASSGGALLFPPTISLAIQTITGATRASTLALFAGSVPGAAPEGILVSDSFTDTDETALGDHTPEVGGNYLPSNSVDFLQTVGNSLQCLNHFGAARSYNTATIPDDVEVSATLTHNGGIGWGNKAGVRARVLGLPNNLSGYEGYYDADTQFWKLRVWAIGTDNTELGTPSAELFNSGSRRVLLRIVGTTLTLLVDDVPRVTATDTTWASGKVGIYLEGGLKDGYLFDDFLAEPPAGAATPQTILGTTIGGSFDVLLEDGSFLLLEDGSSHLLYEPATMGTSEVFPGSVSTGTVTLDVTGATLGPTAVVTPGTVTPGAVTILGATLGSTAVVFAGSVTTLTLITGAHRATTAAVNAGVVTTTTFVSGATIASTATLFPGQVSALVGGATLASTTVVRPGSVAVNVTGATLASSATLFPGSLSPVGATLGPSSQVFPGTVLLGGVLAGATVSSTAQLFPGAVTPGAVIITGATRASSLQLFSGSVTTTTAVSGATRSSTATVFPGTVSPGAVTVGGMTIASSVTLFPGLITTGAVGVLGATIASTALPFPGAVTPGAVTILGATLASTVQLFLGHVFTGLPVTGAIILSGSTLTPGVITPGAVTIVGATITAPLAATHVFPGHLATTTVICSVDFPIDTDALAPALVR